ncbi:hypothetical protein [Tsukamurella soli]|uniref:Uncharacterized protein n=1 Tax=Tsukamurella soli TaxID=644556 RepID=A0ABP8JL66_9ACTN
MDIEERPPWSGRKLARLGEALVVGTPVPDGCPSYDEVALWHFDLCGEVKMRIAGRSDWESFDGMFNVTARPKTIDTLRDKLIRENRLALNHVRDLAGVRVELDGTLAEQTAFAVEVDRVVGHLAEIRRGLESTTFHRARKQHAGYLVQFNKRTGQRRVEEFAVPRDAMLRRLELEQSDVTPTSRSAPWSETRFRPSGARTRATSVVRR